MVQCIPDTLKAHSFLHSGHCPKSHFGRAFLQIFSHILHMQGYYLSSAYVCVCVKRPQEFRWTRMLVTIITSLPYKMEKAMAPYSSTLSWKIPWMEEPGRLRSMGSLRVTHDWSDLAGSAAAYKRWPGMYQYLGNICVYINFYEYTELNSFFPNFLRWGKRDWENSVLLRVLQGREIDMFATNETIPWWIQSKRHISGKYELNDGKV